MSNESPTPPPTDDLTDDQSDDGSTVGPDEQPPPPSAPTRPRPAPPSAPPVRRLVRDPYTRLGGVASGIGHYTGLDTSIVRILFIITTFAGGFGLFVYLLAWLVIPRADHWPPATRPVSFGEMSGRELGIGLALLGLLVAVGFGARGATGAVLVPLALVVGGVWLLVQPPSTPVPATAAGEGGGAAPFVNRQQPVGAPVPPPKRRRRRWLIAFAVIPVLLTLMLVPVLLVLGFAFGSLGDTTRIDPATVDEIPAVISDDVDHLEIDLSRLDANDFSETMPVKIDADVGLGSILVIVPDDIGVSIDSEVGLGSITIFGDTVDGPDIDFQSTAASGTGPVDLELRLDVDLGEIDIERP